MRALHGAICVVVAVVSAGSLPAADALAPAPLPLQERYGRFLIHSAEPHHVGEQLELVARWLEDLLGRPVPGEVRVEILRDAPFREDLRTRFLAEASTLERDLAVYQALNLLPSVEEGRAAVERRFEDGGEGLYDPAARTLRLRLRDTATGVDLVTAAHELVHAIQEDAVGIERLGRQGADEDAAVAGLAVMEGVAELAAQLFDRDREVSTGLAERLEHIRGIRQQAELSAQLALRFREDLRWSAGPAGDDMPLHVPENAQQFVDADLMLPYTLGLAVASAKAQRVLESGGTLRDWFEWSLDLEQVPRCTRDLLLGAGTSAQPYSPLPRIENLEAALEEAGCELVEQGVLGELGLRHLVGYPVRPARRLGALGWLADRLIVARDRRTGEVFAHLTIVFDSPERCSRVERRLLPGSLAPGAAAASLVERRPDRMLHVAFRNPPKVLIDVARRSLDDYQPPPVAVSPELLAERIEAALADQSLRTTDSLRLDAIPPSACESASISVATILFELADDEASQMPRAVGLESMIALGRALAAEPMPEDMREQLRRRALEALERDVPPVGMAGAVRFLSRHGLPAGVEPARVRVALRNVPHAEVRRRLEARLGAGP